MATLPNAAAREHHPTLYFPSGDIILSAPSTRQRCVRLFRVHRFLLAHHSPVFATMLTLPEPGPAEQHRDEVYDGVLVVQLLDTAEDLGALLTLLYNPAHMPRNRLDPNMPLFVGGPIRLAAKYQIEPLRAWLMDHFLSAWPTTLAGWDELNTTADTLRHTLAAAAAAGTVPAFLADHVPEPVAAIYAAQGFGCSPAVRAAYYQLACTPITDTWAPHDAQNAELREQCRVVRWEGVDGRLSMRILRAREAIDDECDELLRSEPAMLTRTYCYAHPCYTVSKAILKHFQRDSRPRDPLQLLLECLDYQKFVEDDEDAVDADQGLCKDCEKALEEWVDRERERVWGLIDQWFGLS